VDGVLWHWIAKSKPIGVQTGTTLEVHVESRLILERADAPGRRIIAVFDSRAVLPTSHRTKYVDFPALTPALACVVIAHAGAAGWNPQTARQDFVMPHAANVLREALAPALGDQKRRNFSARPARVTRA
jgi:hypothetical protein